LDGRRRGFPLCLERREKSKVKCRIQISQKPNALEFSPVFDYPIDMSVAELPIRIDREKIAAFCRARGIRRLSLFGSVLRDDFDPARSDVDVLAEFASGIRPGLKFFGYGEELAEIVGHKVDFNTEAWLSKYFRDEVVREAVPIYEQA